jgi:hypothetical protein
MKRIFIATLLTTGLQAWSQGTFQNLDFESPILPLVRDQVGKVPISQAMPGWSAYRGANQIDGVFYNTIGLGGAVISSMTLRQSCHPSKETTLFFFNHLLVVLLPQLPLLKPD